MANKTGGDVFDAKRPKSCFIPRKGLAGGGQLEVRMEASADHADPDVRGVARRVKFFNLESWHKEWTEVAKKNQELAAGFEQDNRKQTAHEFYFRAADFYRRAVVYMPETDPRMLPTYQKLEENFEKAWSLVTPPFERVEDPLRRSQAPGALLAGTGQGRQQNCRWSTTTAARDGILLRGEDGGAGQYIRRGMSFIDVDGPGHGGTLRHHKLYAPPDSERVAKAVIDYLDHPARCRSDSASACTARAWAVIPARAAPRWKKELKPSRSGAARIISSTTSSIIIRRSRTACAGSWAPRT